MAARGAGRSPSLLPFPVEPWADGEAVSDLSKVAPLPELSGPPMGSESEVHTAPQTGAGVGVPTPRLTGAEDLDAALKLIGRPSRLRRLTVLGEGGMGAVYEYEDQLLRRPVAVKVPHADMAGSPAFVRRFIREAQITAQLEHPNIVPLHDLMMTPDGHLAYVMKRVEGRPLSDVLEGIRKGDVEARRRWGFQTLLLVFRQVCAALAFAHDRGVIHRDVKPDNVLLGEYGEVLLTDWGLAKPTHQDAEDFVSDDMEGLGPEARSRLDAGRVSGMRGVIAVDRTRVKGVLGALRFVAPEQIEGAADPMGPHSDVYSLGVILYCILTGVTPFSPGKGEAIEAFKERLRLQAPPPPSRRSQWGPIDPALERLCLRCLEKLPRDRFVDAGELFQDLEHFIEGVKERERRRELSLLALDRARSQRVRYEELSEWLAQARQEALAIEGRVPHWGDAAAKKAAWEAHDRAQQLAVVRIHVFGEFVGALREALANDPQSREARHLLAEGYLDRAIEAEVAGDLLQKAYYEDQLRATGEPRVWARWQAGGVLSVASGHDGALARIARYREELRRLVPQDAESLGITPIIEIELAQGSYLLTLEAPGKAAARVPVSLGRGERRTVDVPLYAPREIGEGFAYVPPGPYWSGGDPEWDASPRVEIDIGPFAMAVWPVTAEEYCAFLNAVHARSPEEARARAPRDPVEGVPLWLPDDGGAYRVPEVDARNNRWEPRFPIFLVNALDAEAYCAWRSGELGYEVRLPTRVEWEKAARGTDGRYFPWGNTFDPSFCKMRESRAGTVHHPEAIGAFPTDESPYGVRDLAGGVADWSSSWEQEDLQRRYLGGGGWFSHARNCRLARRFGFAHTDVSAGVGFRLARSLPPPVAKRRGGSQGPAQE